METEKNKIIEARQETNDGRWGPHNKVQTGTTMEPIMKTIMVLWKKTSPTCSF